MNEHREFDVSKFLKMTRVNYEELPNTFSEPMVMHDGFQMSVQASEFHFCSPRNSNGPWTHFEVGFPSSLEELLMPYVEDEENPTDTVYARVPEEVIRQVILLHGGIQVSIPR